MYCFIWYFVSKTIPEGVAFYVKSNAVEFFQTEMTWKIMGNLILAHQPGEPRPYKAF